MNHVSKIANKSMIEKTKINRYILITVGDSYFNKIIFNFALYFDVASDNQKSHSYSIWPFYSSNSLPVSNSSKIFTDFYFYFIIDFRLFTEEKQMVEKHFS